MLNNLISLDRRAVMRASLAILGVAVVAACDTDRPTSPIAAPSAEAPKSAEGMVTADPRGTLVWATVSTYKQLIVTGPATYDVTGPLLYHVVVTDNSGVDADTTLGKLQLNSLKPGLYKVCETKAPPEFAPPDSLCHSGMVYGNVISAVAAFVHPWLPLVHVSYKDQNGVLVGGGGFTVKDTLGNVLQYIGDDGIYDVDKTPGMFYFRLPASGKVSLCATNIAAGYSLPVGYMPCLTNYYFPGTTTSLGAFPLVPAPSIAWRNSDMNWNTLAGGTFQISNLLFGISFNVTDNGPNDLDPTPGKFLVKMGKAISYNLCEVTPPTNYFMSNPQCQTVDVTSGQSVWGGLFMHQEKQVIRY
jgi:hypothetical protein